MRPGSGGRDFPVVCVGGSAGGLDAYIRLLRHMPSDMPESAIASGCIDFILSPEDIALEIARIAHAV
jgi:two-component system chemotaxis response regulator CheB